MPRFRVEPLLRITLLNQYYAPDEAATAQLLADLGEGLAGRGHTVTAICGNRSYADPSRRYSRSEAMGGVRVRRVRCTAFGRGSKLGRLADYATFVAGASLALAASERPDAIVALSTPPLVAALGLACARCRRIGFVYWVMDVYPDVAYELGVMKPGSIVGRSVQFMSKWTVRGSDRVVALDEAMARRLRAHVDRDIAVIPNWADGDVIRPRPAAGHPLRRSWGWERRLVVLYSGNMGLAHEFETVLRAADRLRDAPEILFAFVGDGPRRGEIEKTAREMGLPNIDLRPYVPRSDLGGSLTAGDVHLITLRERMPGLVTPSKIYGIMAAGRPTIYVGPADGDVAHIVDGGGCGVRVPNGDVDGLVAAVLGYARDETRRLSEGERARVLFDERYTRELGVEAFRGLIEGLARPGKRPT